MMACWWAGSASLTIRWFSGERVESNLTGNSAAWLVGDGVLSPRVGEPEISDRPVEWGEPAGRSIAK